MKFQTDGLTHASTLYPHPRTPTHPTPTHPQPLTHIHLEREDQLFNPQQPISDSGCGALPFWDSCISDCIISNDGRINLHGVS